MCDLASANLCHAALEPRMEDLAKEAPGGGVVAFWDDEAGEVRIRAAHTFHGAARFQEEVLTERQRATSVLVQIPKKSCVWML